MIGKRDACIIHALLKIQRKKIKFKKTFFFFFGSMSLSLYIKQDNTLKTCSDWCRGLYGGCMYVAIAGIIFYNYYANFWISRLAIQDFSLLRFFSHLRFVQTKLFPSHLHHDILVRNKCIRGRPIHTYLQDAERPVSSRCTHPPPPPPIVESA